MFVVDLREIVKLSPNHGVEVGSLARALAARGYKTPIGRS